MKGQTVSETIRSVERLISAILVIGSIVMVCGLTYEYFAERSLEIADLIGAYLFFGTIGTFSTFWVLGKVRFLEPILTGQIPTKWRFRAAWAAVGMGILGLLSTAITTDGKLFLFLGALTFLIPGVLLLTVLRNLRSYGELSCREKFMRSAIGAPIMLGLLFMFYWIKERPLFLLVGLVLGSALFLIQLVYTFKRWKSEHPFGNSKFGGRM